MSFRKSNKTEILIKAVASKIPIMETASFWLIAPEAEKPTAIMENANTESICANELLPIVQVQKQHLQQNLH